MKKVTRNIISVVLVLLIGLLLAIGLFIVFTDAPILRGNVEYNLPYKNELQLDVYLPTRKVYPKAPVVLFFHGGAWIVGRKELVNSPLFNKAFNQLRDKGYAIVAPEYTLAEWQRSPFPACIQDAFDALEWIVHYSEDYDFDLNNVGVFGESAGAHLALMVAYSDAELFDVKRNVALKYVVDVYGPTDLYDLYRAHTPMIDSIGQVVRQFSKEIVKNLDVNQYLFGFDPASDSLRTINFAKQYSPVEYIHQDLPPILIVHGDNDRVVPVEQSFKLKSLLDSQRQPNEFILLPGVGHALLYASRKDHKNVQDRIVQFITKHYHE